MEILLFVLLETLQWNGHNPIHNFRYYEMGQICVAKDTRQREFLKCFINQHKKSYSHKFDLLVTQISTKNHRSLRAHKKVGFETAVVGKRRIG